MVKHIKKISPFIIPITIAFPLNNFISCAKCNHQKGKLKSIQIQQDEKIIHPAKYCCELCKSEYIDSLTSNEINMPIIDINGDLSGISKEQKVQVACSYIGLTTDDTFDVDCTLKWQGSGAISLDKKNYNIQFFKKNSEYTEKFKKIMSSGWTNESKYTLKANWADGVVSRNIIASKLYGDLIKSEGIYDEPNQLLNGGAIDGFPILLYINKEYVGLYTFQIAKDKQLFQTPDGTVEPQCILFAQNITDSTSFNENIASDLSNGWKMEYFNKSFAQEKYIDSLNQLISFTINSNDTDFVNNIEKYLDINRTIDYLIHTEILGSTDNITHNIIWVTYNGEKWMPSAYDLDGSLGFYPNGSQTPHDFDPDFTTHNLFNRIIKLFSNLFVSKIKTAFNGCLSVNEISRKVNDFYFGINSLVYDSNIQKWPLPFAETNTIQHCLEFVKNRHDYLVDKYK